MTFMKEKNNLKLTTGFTLIEAVLYLAIAGVVLYFISGFAFNTIFGKNKIDDMESANQEASSVLDQISSDINNSVNVNNISQ